MFSTLYAPPPRTTTVGQHKHNRCGMSTIPADGVPVGLLAAGLLAAALFLLPRRRFTKG